MKLLRIVFKFLLYLVGIVFLLLVLCVLLGFFLTAYNYS